MNIPCQLIEASVRTLLVIVYKRTVTRKLALFAGENPPDARVNGLIGTYFCNSNLEPMRHDSVISGPRNPKLNIF